MLSPGMVFRAREALVAYAPDDPDLLERTLGVKLRVPESDLERQLVNVAKTNARHALEQAKKKDGGHGIAALEEIQEKLHLSKLPTRIECYDNSNIQGEDAVASRDGTNVKVSVQLPAADVAAMIDEKLKDK